MGKILELRKYGQSIWLDNLTREYFADGSFLRWINDGVCGVTSNPTIFENAIKKSPQYDGSIRKYAAQGLDAERILTELEIEDIRQAADIFRPVFERTAGADGYISIEVSPRLAHDAGGTVKQALELYSRLERPNIMIKVPATKEGMTAIRELIGEGVSINATLLFSLASYRAAAQAYIDGLKDRKEKGRPVHYVRSVASFFVSRVDTAADTALETKAGQMPELKEKLLALRGKTAIAQCKCAYKLYGEIFGGQFAPLQAAGAHKQRLLWASTGTKNPAYSKTMYVDGLIGPDTVNTIPEATLAEFLKSGSVTPTLTEKTGEAEALLSETGKYIDLDEICGRLEADGVAKFAESYGNLINAIEAKK
ncbi:MAG: transaldolase [Elusimicrobiaceae bacterium]